MRLIETQDHITIIQEEETSVQLEFSDCKVQPIEHDISTGPPGIDAYHLALNNGFVGTREEWLRSLTAYGIALDNGFVGTEEEWLESLKGESGIQIDAADAGQLLSNDGQDMMWVSLEYKLNTDDITWDLGEL